MSILCRIIGHRRIVLGKSVRVCTRCDRDIIQHYLNYVRAAR